MKRLYSALFACSTLTCAMPVAASCGSNVCALHTPWNVWDANPGAVLDLRYSQIKLDQLRSGNNKINANPLDPANTGVEVENLYTDNRLLTATLDYTLNESTSFQLQLPFVMRTHKHSIGDPNPALVTVESFDAKALGDIRATGRYRLTLDDASHVGLNLGLKLPTGKTDARNDAGVVPAEPTLQPGNGSTDLLLGAFWQHGGHGDALGYFAQATLQTSIKHRSGFTPGAQINLDVGLRYALMPALALTGQLSYQKNGNDTVNGASDPLTGGRFLFATPGVTFAATPTTSLYGMLQIPLSQNVNGEQLTASGPGYTLGVSQRF